VVEEQSGEQWKAGVLRDGHYIRFTSEQAGDDAHIWLRMFLTMAS